jgi:hypothetical protein
MTWTGNKIKHRSVTIFITATPRQKPTYNLDQSALSSLSEKELVTKLTQVFPAPMNLHGSAGPHCNAPTQTDTTPHIAMNAISPMPIFRCGTAMLIIMSSEIIESFANANVAMYKSLFAYSPCTWSARCRRRYTREKVHRLSHSRLLHTKEENITFS